MFTSSSNNSFVDENILYIVPTLTSDVLGPDAIFNGHMYNLTDCTSSNASACGVVSNMTERVVVNPVQSARLTMINATSMRYGRVEVEARLPKGDWIWPRIYMLPVNDTYGFWPMSGEIDVSFLEVLCLSSILNRKLADFTSAWEQRVLRSSRPQLYSLYAPVGT